jgi:putative SOS response-associated peptidase YedK
MQSRRCLLPAAGWYEWRVPGTEGGVVPGKTKQPYFVTGTDGTSLAMAGLWEFWRPRDGGDPLVTAAVLTTDAVGPLAEIHERMPLLLAPEHWADWLDPDVSADADRIAALLAPPSDALVARLELRPVSTQVNNVRNEGPSLTSRVEVDTRPETSADAEPTLTLDLG